jgi:hypothetical protein
MLLVGTYMAEGWGHVKTVPYSENHPKESKYILYIYSTSVRTADCYASLTW